MILGIDLGTTNSACAIWRNGQSELVPNRFGDYLTPSVVSVDETGELLVGKLAKSRLITHPTQCASLFKRLMGTEQSMTIGTQSYRSEELSAMVLKSLKQDAEELLGETVSEAIISVPAYFNNHQREATKLAGQLAGLTVDRLVNEPTAAAMAYGLHEKKEDTQFIVLDLGGGTFDVSLMEHFDGVLEVHASAGDNQLGGEDFLETLVEWYYRETALAVESLDKGQVQRVYARLEQVKRELSQTAEVVIEPFIDSIQAPQVTLTRHQFEQLTRPILDRIQEPVERALADAGVMPSALDDVVLVGGASRMSAFKSLVARLFRRMPSANLDPDLIVALGAGVQAGLKAQDAALDDVVLTDVCPYSLGVGIYNPHDHRGDQGALFAPLIERNSTVPVSKMDRFATVGDQQKEVRFKIYQGESRRVSNNVLLGEITIPVTPAPAGEEGIDVRFTYDMNGILDVDVTVTSTGKTFQKTIINNHNKLTEDQIAEKREALAALKFHPRDDEMVRELLSRAEHLFEASLGEARQAIAHQIQWFESVLEGQDSRLINDAKEEFGQFLSEFESHQRW